jgi:hypothetical protein
MTMAYQYEPTIQHEDFVWRLVSKGTERDGKTYCHLAAMNQKQRDGKTPVQIADWISNEKLRRAGL